ncbi:hypothetical protein NP493_488g00021 [Ridgeia piscesae]|uniref:Uncharacterized protein n=1 Tax=Ridgeia piscesae TaxID=27915 RepID=A0AAD9KXN2_RIDPI|nr:hypothetical protein NP493_488g00021 [Ridgeia piscesae]
MAVTEKLAESPGSNARPSKYLSVFQISASFDHLSMSPRLVTRLCISAFPGFFPARCRYDGAWNGYDYDCCRNRRSNFFYPSLVKPVPYYYRQESYVRPLPLEPMCHCVWKLRESYCERYSGWQSTVCNGCGSYVYCRYGALWTPHSLQEMPLEQTPL